MKSAIAHVQLTTVVLVGLAGVSFPVAATLATPPTPPPVADAPFATTLASEQGESSRSVTVLTNDDGREVKVVLEDGVYTIWVDGEKVKSGDFADAPRVMSIDKDGKAVATLRRTGDAAYNVRFNDDEREIRERAARELRRSFRDLEGRDRALTALRLQPGEDDEVRVIAEIAHQPKVMMGVTMEELPESLAAQLDLENEGATLLTGVLDGLPAQKSGLRVHDVIVSVNGDGDASPASIRERLQDLKPGDELKLRVLRSGRERDVTLKLEAFNPEALGIAPNVVRRWGEDRSFPTAEDVAPKSPPIIEVEQYLRKMQESFEQQFDSEEFEAYFGELSRLLEDVEMQFEEAPGGFTFDVEIPGLKQRGAGAISIFPDGDVFSGEDFQVFIPGEDGEARAITIPRAPATPGLSGQWRAETTSALTERMDAIDARLDRIESMLERLLHDRHDDSH